MKIALAISLIFSVQVFAAETLKVAAGAAPIDNIFKKIEAPFEKAHPEYDLVLTRVVPKDSLVALDKGEVDGASLAFAKADWLKKVEEEGYKHKGSDAYKARVIGKDLTLIAKNKANTVKKLTNDQIKKIFTGEIKNWSEVGGSKTDILVVYSKHVPGMNKFFQQSILKGAEFSPKAKILDVEKDPIALVKKELESNAGAVAFIPYGSKDGNIEVFETEEIGRPVTFATLGDPSAKVLKLLDFIYKNSNLLK